MYIKFTLLCMTEISVVGVTSNSLDEVLEVNKDQSMMIGVIATCILKLLNLKLLA